MLYGIVSKRQDLYFNFLFLKMIQIIYKVLFCFGFLQEILGKVIGNFLEVCLLKFQMCILLFFIFMIFQNKIENQSFQLVLNKFESDSKEKILEENYCIMLCVVGFDLFFLRGIFDIFLFIIKLEGKF